MNEITSKVYIQTDSANHITACEGGYTSPADLTGWVQIDEGAGDKYNLCQSHYFEGGLYDKNGKPRYKYINGQAALCEYEPTLDELKADALERISGKCSAAIYSGVTVNGTRYTLSEHEQAALSIAQSKVDKGAAAVIYGDGLTDAATITALSQAAYEWGVVCTTYYAYLKQYIAVETDVDKLAAVTFGKALPDSYMQQLAALLSSAGIDITKYTAALTGG